MSKRKGRKYRGGEMIMGFGVCLGVVGFEETHLTPPPNHQKGGIYSLGALAFHTEAD